MHKKKLTFNNVHPLSRKFWIMGYPPIKRLFFQVFWNCEDIWVGSVKRARLAFIYHLIILFWSFDSLIFSWMMTSFPSHKELWWIYQLLSQYFYHSWENITLHVSSLLRSSWTDWLKFIWIRNKAREALDWRDVFKTLETKWRCGITEKVCV